ncbi:MAG: MBL fold metallo-hydrolase [Deltaproteobacteria bacterium]|nr:MBL fold metallo-hydrolase [Deltaproteobacteria bacterium]
MGFEDLLKRKLGPMADLVVRGHKPEHPAPDPTGLFYRRALGLEATFHPESSWAELEVGRSDVKERVRLPLAKAALVLGLTDWRSPAELEVDAKSLWRMVEDGLLYWAHERPTRRLHAGSATGNKVARRGGVWPTGAVETAIEIAPMPFMPRAKDLAGAKWVGARFAVLERGHEIFGLTVTGSEKIGRLVRQLLPLLNGRHTLPEILEAFPKAERHDAEKLLGVLELCNLLETRDGPPDPGPLLDRTSEARVTWLGHGAVLLQSLQANLLIDPIFYAMSEPSERWLSAPRFDPRALPKLHAIVITHGDNDHLNPNALAQLPKEVPVIVPALSRPPLPYQVDIAGMLRLLGFEEVVELPAWEHVAVGDWQVTACPFEGESWGLELPKATYLIENAEVATYFSADAATMDSVYQDLARRGRRIDLAFMGVSGNAEAHLTPAELGYGNFYADWIPKVRYQEWVQHCAGPEEAARSLQILEPRYAFGYAAGGASYIRTSYSDLGDHDQLARLLEGRGTQPVALRIGEPVAFSALGQLPRYISP